MQANQNVLTAFDSIVKDGRLQQAVESLVFHEGYRQYMDYNGMPKWCVNSFRA